jgi:hypothetical protein
MQLATETANRPATFLINILPQPKARRPPTASAAYLERTRWGHISPAEPGLES